jgi:hypothetical protein
MSIKKLNYFTGQFLKVEDFRDEQRYHIEALSKHNKYLHSWGIVSGLDVSFIEGKKHVIVDKGMAIDETGRQIILEDAIDIDLSTSTAPILYLTISYKEIEIDPVEETGIKGNTRISEEPVIELNTKMPHEPSMKLFLAKITLDPDNKTVVSIDTKKRKKIGISGDFEVNSIVFILPKIADKWPKIKGKDGSKPHLEIESENTSITGNLDVAGTLNANLGANIVSTDQVKDKSIPLSKIKTRNVVSVSGTIAANSNEAVAKETSDSHRFFMTSVIPLSPGSLEWRWNTEKKKDKLSYILMLRNTSDKNVDYEIKYYDLSDK